MPPTVIEVEVNNVWARSIRRSSTKRAGGTPTVSLNRWLKRETESCTASAIIETVS